MTEKSTLHLHLTVPGYEATGLCGALRRISEKYRCYRWREDVPKGRLFARDHVLELMAQDPPTLVWAQLQSPFFEAEDLGAFRRALAPGGLLVTWGGDVSPPNSLSDQDLLWQARVYGAANLALQAAHLQVGYDTDWFHNRTAEPRTTDVAFIGSMYRGWLPEAWVLPRVNAVSAVRQAFGSHFELYGAGWGSAVQPIPLEAFGDVYRRSLCVISCSANYGARGLSSARLPRALACGCCVLVERFDGFEEWGLIDQVNCVMWETPSELVAKLQFLVAHREKALAIGRAGAKLAAERHTWEARIQAMVPLLAATRGER